MSNERILAVCSLYLMSSYLIQEVSFYSYPVSPRHHHLLPPYWIILISTYIRIFTILKVTFFWFNITLHLTSYFLCSSSWQDFFQELSKLCIKCLFYFLLYLILWGFNAPLMPPMILASPKLMSWMKGNPN